jgi:hypothetical protein
VAVAVAVEGLQSGTVQRAGLQRDCRAGLHRGTAGTGL